MPSAVTAVPAVPAVPAAPAAPGVDADGVPRGDVRATLNFYRAPADGAAPFNYVQTPPPGAPQRNFGDDPREVLIRDLRSGGRAAAFSATPAALDEHSVLLVQGVPPSAAEEEGASAFADDEAIRARYYPEVEALLLRHIPGSHRVVIFDHTIRRGSKAAVDGAGDAASARTPVTRAHIDQTPDAAVARVRRHLPADEAEALLRGRVRIVNVWRPLNRGPVAAFPLAFASSASVADEDVVAVEHRYPHFTGHTAAIRHHPDQQWYYLSGMTADERLLLQCYDSDARKPGSAVRGGRLPHSAFVDPRTPPDAAPRESIEVRALVFGP